jgi:hypothetical protein
MRVLIQSIISHLQKGDNLKSDVRHDLFIKSLFVMTFLCYYLSTV